MTQPRKIIMDTQRLRNLTTGLLHTEMGHIYEDLETITGTKGIMTHMIPRIARAIKPWILEHVQNSRFWDGKYDLTHTGNYALPEPTAYDRAVMLALYKEQPDPLEGKTLIVVQS